MSLGDSCSGESVLTTNRSDSAPAPSDRNGQACTPRRGNREASPARGITCPTRIVRSSGNARCHVNRALLGAARAAASLSLSRAVAEVGVWTRIDACGCQRGIVATVPHNPCRPAAAYLECRGAAAPRSLCTWMNSSPACRTPLHLECRPHIPCACSHVPSRARARE